MSKERERTESEERLAAGKIAGDVDAAVVDVQNVIARLRAKGIQVSGGMAAGSAATDNLGALQAKLNAAQSEARAFEGQELQRDLGNLIPLAFLAGRTDEPGRGGGGIA